MSRFILSGALEKVLGLNNQYLLLLSRSTFELINSLLDQIEYDAKTPETIEVYRKASKEIMDMASLQDLLGKWDETNERLAYLSCICQAIQSGNLSGGTYDVPPDYPGLNPGYVSGQVVSPSTPIPDQILNQGVTDYAGWQLYICKATELVRRAALVMIEELLRIFDTPVLVFGIVAATLGAVAAILAVLALPSIVVGPAIVASFVAGMLAVGQGGLEACRDYLLDPSGTVWANIACIAKSAGNARSAELEIHDYIDNTAPETAKAILKLFPWKGWFNQVYQGLTADGQGLDVTGLQSLCVDCEEEAGWFSGIHIDNCELTFWTNEANGRMYQNRMSCIGDGEVTELPEYTDGVYGRFAGDPVTISSPSFEVPETGDYNFRFRLCGFQGEEANALIAIRLVSDDTLVVQHSAAANNNNGELQQWSGISLAAATPYYVRVLFIKLVFECYDDSFVLVP